MISQRGRSDITDHLQTKKYKAALQAVSLGARFVSLIRCVAAEDTFAYHYVKLDLSFGTSHKLFSVFDGNIFCGRTKSEATATNVLGPYANEELSKGLSEATFVTEMRTHLTENQ
jgi:hypothetical protein